MKRRLPAPLLVFASVGMLTGVLVSTLRSEERPNWPGAIFVELEQMTRLEPVRVFPHLEMSLVALEARRTLDAGRPWEAWRQLRDYVDDPDVAASHVMLTARAAAGWNAWDHVRDALQGRDWLARAESGEGLFLLARAYEELNQKDEAARTYARYAALPDAPNAGIALSRLATMQAQEGDLEAAAEMYGRAASAAPEIADWLTTLQVEALAPNSTALPVSLVTSSSPVTAPARLRRVQAEAEVRVRAGDVEGALRKMEWEERVLRAQGAIAEATDLRLARGLLLIEVDSSAEARRVLRSAAWESGASGATRGAAADALGQLEPLDMADHLARSAAYEAAAKPGLAARALRTAISVGVTDEAGLQLRAARLFYDERDYPSARTAFLRAAELQSDRELVAEARLYAARSLFRTGSRSRSAALAEMRRVTENYPGTAAAGTAFYLLGDESSSIREALSLYRRAAAIKRSPDAREALFRVGDRSLRLDDVAGALRAWEEYVERYPRGDATARVAYEAGKLHERAGRSSKAREMYRAAIAADPVSYYAFRAGSRLGEHPVDRLLEQPSPWIGLASDPADAQTVLNRLDALEQAGLRTEWEQELASARRVLNHRPAALLALAEGVRDRGHIVEGLRIGWDLLEKRNGEWDPRLLRVVYPLPYRELIEAEAEREGIDPMLLAGLIRQESTFRPEIRSWVGATGLTQIMPTTGSWLASRMGIPDYEQRLLTVPEVNVRMGARYLRDQLRTYDGARDLALAAYNAGPSRASRWRRELNHGRDTDAFREAIPFAETRNYVKIVLRNAALYARLYAEERPVGLVMDER